MSKKFLTAETHSDQLYTAQTCTSVFLEGLQIHLMCEKQLLSSEL